MNAVRGRAAEGPTSDVPRGSVGQAAHGAAGMAATTGEFADAATATVATVGGSRRTIAHPAELSRELSSVIGRFRI